MTFKCRYCDSETHVEIDCSKWKSDRRLEFGFGCLMLIIMSPFALLGAIAGAAWGAAKSGFNFCEDFWTEGWKSVRNGKKSEGNGSGEAG